MNNKEYKQKLATLVMRFIDDVTQLSTEHARAKLLAMVAPSDVLPQNLTPKDRSQIAAKAVAKVAKKAKKSAVKEAKKVVEKIEKRTKKNERSLKDRQKEAKKAYRLRAKQRNSQVLTDEQQQWLNAYNAKHPTLAQFTS